MKKLRLITGLGIILALSFLTSCSNKSSGHSSSERAEVKKDPAKDEQVYNAQAGEQSNLPCSSDNDCALVPKGDCFGCLKSGGSHYVTTAQEAKQMWKDKEQTCAPQLKDFFEGGKFKKEDMSQAPSCKSFNGVSCQEGQCLGVLLTEEQQKARAQKAREHMQQMQGQGGQGSQGGQGRQMGGPQRSQTGNGQRQPMDYGRGPSQMGGRE